MKRSKRILVLAAILAVACIATYALSQYEEKQEQIQNTDAVLLEIAPDTVQTLSWQYAEDGLGFHKGESNWLYDADEAFPVSEEKVNDILSHFESFRVAFIIEQVEDYSQYGLDEPECTISFSTADASYEIKLGAFSKMDEQRYIDIGDGNVYLASEDPMDFLETKLSAMILHDDTPSFDQVTDLSFAGLENYQISFVEDSTDSYHPDDIYFTEQDGQNLPLDTDTVENYLDAISALSLQDYATYNATEEELETFGLNNPELTVTINYTYTDEEDNELSDTCVIHIGQNPEELNAANEAAASGLATLPSVSKYVRIGDSPIVYELTDTNYDKLTAISYDELRHQEVIWAEFDQVTQIDVSLEGNNHSITSTLDEEAENADRVWFYGEQELDISELQTALQALTADSFTDETADQKEEISLTVYLDNENFPQVTIQLYRYDGSLCLAVVDGESVSLVSRSAVMDLVEAVQTIVLN
ncbi:MAG: DUF4340 domain-containing protein [Lachnospiraceae bacterium]|nr:DUF4340 domain-containing protein [Lachnospiraceae bacterium]